jgi:hypothetical protein
VKNDVIESIMHRFPYLNVDVSSLGVDASSSVSPNHPQLIFESCNRIDDTRAREYSCELDGVAHQWADQPTPADNAQFMRAYENLLAMLEAVSASSILLLHENRLLSERPGTEVDNKRRGEISAWCKSVIENWVQSDASERVSLCRLALVGICPLHVEVVNYLSTAQVPVVLGRMLSRLDCLSGKSVCAKTGAQMALMKFNEIEAQVLNASQSERTSIPVGTWPRIYAPREALARDQAVYDATLEAMESAESRQAALVRFLSLVWLEFADEAFLTVHEGDTIIHAYALVGGCCLYYRGDLDTSTGKPAIRSKGKPVYLDTAGSCCPTPWRRQFERLCFDGGDDGLENFRRDLIAIEAQPIEQRAESARAGFILRAAQRLLNRQINYNISSVLNKQMHRLSVDEWAPNMCRDRNGRIYNIPHAYGGVGDMFRGLLDHGQFRCWREVDGSYDVTDMRQFRGYKHALDHFLFNQKAEPAELESEASYV